MIGPVQVDGTVDHGPARRLPWQEFTAIRRARPRKVVGQAFSAALHLRDRGLRLVSSTAGLSTLAPRAAGCSSVVQAQSRRNEATCRNRTCSVSQSGACQRRREGGTSQTTDGKIKAPTAVGRMWLVGLRFLAIFRVALPALCQQRATISTARAPSLAAMPRKVGREERRRRSADSPRPHSRRRSRRRQAQEFRRPGDAGREEGGPCRALPLDAPGAVRGPASVAVAARPSLFPSDRPAGGSSS